MRSIAFATLLLPLPGSVPDCLAQAGPSHSTVSKGSDTFQVPHAPAQARPQLAAHLAGLADPALRRRYRLMIEFGAPLFPPDEQIALDASQRGGPHNGLERWLQLEPARRRFDLLILPDVDYFWPADLHVAGLRPQYSTAFILHLEPSAEGKTTVQVLQINSMARFGKKFDLLGRTGPKFYWDDRPVPPSPQAAKELIGHLTGAGR